MKIYSKDEIKRCVQNHRVLKKLYFIFLIQITQIPDSIMLYKMHQILSEEMKLAAQRRKHLKKGISINREHSYEYNNETM